MSELGLISVITPVFKATRTLARAIQSLQMQTYTNWECIIIADDGFDYQNWLTKKGIKEERLRFSASFKNQSGPNIARNIGKKLALGQWIAPLDADDLYYPERLRSLLEAAQFTGLALDNVSVVDDETNKVIRHAFDLEKRDILLEDILVSNTPLLMLFHHDVANHDWEDVARGGDTIFNLLALEQAKKAGYVPTALHEYRVHPQSLCHSPDVGEKFHQAYQYTLQRLRTDRMGFQSDEYHQRVIAMIERKQYLNQSYEQALRSGFSGTFQRFCSIISDS